MRGAATRSISVGANTLTDTNTVGATTGKVSGARDFELSNSEYFTIADNAALSVGDVAFTVAAWVNLESSRERRRCLRNHQAPQLSMDCSTSPLSTASRGIPTRGNGF